MMKLLSLLCSLALLFFASAFSPLTRPRYSSIAPVRDHRNGVALQSEVSVNQSSDSTERSTQLASSSPRRVARIEKFARLPVWPAWNGVFLFAISKILGEEVAAKLEDTIGGRVCPNFFQDADQTSPFIMLVHHCHSFGAFDPLRYFQRTFFPEGFPSHPHRGFITVTYILKGGFTHRDSLGIKQAYGAEERHGGKHTQWLMTGGGMLHEEMFDMGGAGSSDQELYQLWLNVPGSDKMLPPSIKLLGGPDETPTVITKDATTQQLTETIVIAGSHGGKTASVELLSDVSILHVKMEPGTTWKHELPPSHETAVIYMRQGSILMDDDEQRIPPHYTAYLAKQGQDLTVVAEENGADFLLLAGQPLREPVAAQGSMVMNSAYEIETAYADYQRGNMGFPWSEKLSDEDWVEHVKKFPSRYNLVERQ